MKLYNEAIKSLLKHNPEASQTIETLVANVKDYPESLLYWQIKVIHSAFTTRLAKDDQKVFAKALGQIETARDKMLAMLQNNKAHPFLDNCNLQQALCLMILDRRETALEQLTTLIRNRRSLYGDKGLFVDFKRLYI